MHWIQISIVTAENIEEIEAVLLAHSCSSVTIVAVDSKDILEPLPGETPLWEQSKITGLFEATADIQSIEAALEGVNSNHEITVEQLEDQDWVRSCMDNFKPMRFGKRLWVCPLQQNPPDQKAINLRLDPGLAFGTGTHPTTSLCLKWLDENIDIQSYLLDYGCGSGILAIAAVLLGVKNADAVDIDTQAITATFNNAKTNNVLEHIDACLPSKLFQTNNAEKYNVVIANILSGPLIELASILTHFTKPKSDLVLSGILSEQTDKIVQCYSANFRINQVVEQDGWALIHGTRL